MTLDPTLRPLLATFVAEAESIAATIRENLLLAEQSQSAEELSAIHDEIGRGLHTLKGTAGTFGLEDLSAMAHELEDSIEPAALLGGLDDLLRTLRGYAEDSERREVVGDLERLVRDTCRRSGKRAALSIIGHAIAIEPRVLQAVRGSLVQLVENAVDHGIEAPAEREQAGKPNEASIQIRIESKPGALRIEVSDDGRGIVRELREIVFRPGFSTSPAITASSGRGMGLDIVRTEIEKLRGRVELESHEGRGTTFVIVVPSD